MYQNLFTHAPTLRLFDCLGNAIRLKLKLSIWMNYTRVRNVWFTNLPTIRTNYKRFTIPFLTLSLSSSSLTRSLRLGLDECDCFKFIASRPVASEAYSTNVYIHLCVLNDMVWVFEGRREKKNCRFGVRNYWNILNDCHAMLYQEHVIIHLKRDESKKNDIDE